MLSLQVPTEPMLQVHVLVPLGFGPNQQAAAALVDTVPARGLQIAVWKVRSQEVQWHVCMAGQGVPSGAVLWCWHALRHLTDEVQTHTHGLPWLPPSYPPAGHLLQRDTRMVKLLLEYGASDDLPFLLDIAPPRPGTLFASKASKNTDSQPACCW